jgi:hypothetical protein
VPHEGEIWGLMQPFIVSIFAGILFPILPMVAELLVTNHIKPETLTITAVVYVAAVGLISRYQAITFSSLFFSTMCAIIYGGYESELSHSNPNLNFVTYGPTITFGTIFFYSICYAVERFGRHYIENEPFLEF